MKRFDFGGKRSENNDADSLDLAIAKLPARMRHAFLAIGSLACTRPANEIAAGLIDSDPLTDWLPVALVPIAAPKSGKRRFSLSCGARDHEHDSVSLDVATAVALLHRGLLCSVPGQLSNLTLSTHAVELLRSGSVTIRQVRNVKAAWSHEEMDRRWDRAEISGKTPNNCFYDSDTAEAGLVA
ncbi:hypothetical protein J2X48_001374 [Bosea sp. BE271]|uniref:hypothetical protein n=1 Tax=Bosea TaxID=85413 RepID=UPI0028667C40|nr:MULTISPECIES: hypothetical protein [Bosea]MDR6827648.1 hypothetical protein [Bosea robiniae]MDR6894658.1 hypothetical protein [Bosea sp. BE109]MDR7137754.1 hypothetical protein [Bosea sp. BE168]MDR7174453.1 hypothetical protein [Bosea sp. BE271]